MSETRETQYLAIPQLGAKFVEPSGVLAAPWRAWFIQVWLRLGAATASLVGSVYFTVVDGIVYAYQAIDGVLLGRVVFSGSTGGTSVVLSPGSSPFTYEAPVAGTVVVTAGQVELSRGTGWVLVSPMGGAVPVMAEDQVRVTWFGLDPATVTFFPEVEL